MILLNSLPDELWIMILKEWIGKITTFCAFDSSVCNKLLRERYLYWLHSTTATMLSTIHHGKICVEENANGNQESLMSNLFVKWCMKRRLYPKSLSITFQPDIFPLKETDAKYNDFLEIFQHVEILKDCKCVMFRENNFICDFLNDFPKLKVLQLSSPNLYSARFFTFSFDHFTIYPLIHLELSVVKVSFSENELAAFVSVFPLLEVVMFMSCEGVSFQHVEYLIRNVLTLTTIHFQPCFGYNDEDEGEDDAVNAEIYNNIQRLKLLLGGDIKQANRSMKCLKLFLNNISGFSTASSSSCYDVGSILSLCPCLEEFALKGFGHFDEDSKDFPFVKIIRKNWRQLRVLEWEQSAINIEMIQSIVDTCASTLTDLRFAQVLCEEQDMLIVIAQSFPHLQSLEVRLCNVVDETILANAFANAVFRLTLKTFIYPYIMSSASCKIILQAFPALQSLEICLKEDYTPILTSYPAMNQINCLKFSFLGEFDLISKPGVFRLYPGILDLSNYHSLQELSLAGFSLSPMELCSIFALPALQRLQLMRVITKTLSSLLDPNSYPVSNTLVAPLKILDLSFSSEYNRSLCFITRDTISALLRRFTSRFTSLETIKVKYSEYGKPGNAKGNGKGELQSFREWWKQLQEGYRYRVELINTNQP